MPYRPHDHLKWDFWFAPQRGGEPWHAFYPRMQDDQLTGRLSSSVELRMASAGRLSVDLGSL